MPNNTSIEMVVTGPTEVLELFCASHIIPIPDSEQTEWSGDNYFDFNTIVPSPRAMHSEDDSLEAIMSRSQMTQADRDADEARREARAEANLEKYGFSGWYEWNCANWGTKWNSYDNSINTDHEANGHVQVNFQTAWTLPEPIFNELMELYPELTFEVTCLEEGGFFYGVIVYADGEADESAMGYDSEGWTAFARDHFGYDWLDDDEEESGGSETLLS